MLQIKQKWFLKYFWRVICYRFMCDRSCNTKLLYWCFFIFLQTKKFENLPQKVPNWADLSLFCFNDWSKVWRLTLASKWTILSRKFIGSLLLGKLTNKFNAVLANLLIEKNWKCVQKIPCPGLRHVCLLQWLKLSSKACPGLKNEDFELKIRKWDIATNNINAVLVYLFTEKKFESFAKAFLSICKKSLDSLRPKPKGDQRSVRAAIFSLKYLPTARHKTAFE